MKSLLCEAPVLTNFNDSIEITIHSDASEDGIDCCLLQENKPVFFAFRSLTENEKNGCVHYGKKNIADIVSPRLQRIKLRLTKYGLDVKYIPGKNLFVAVLMLRNFLKDNVQDDSTMLIYMYTMLYIASHP